MKEILLLSAGFVAGFVAAKYWKIKTKGLIEKQAQEKEKNLEKILEYMREKDSVGNNDIEKLLNVSDATATRYMEELEKQGKAVQVGDGRSARYKIN